MSEELLIELKTAGFPQITNEDLLPSPYRPSLSELLKACGSGFALLERNRRGKFIAVGNAMHFLGSCRGECPEEAVAKLFIALHSEDEFKKQMLQTDD